MKEMSRPMERYGKSAEGILGASQGFYADNDAYLAEALRQAALYREQPRRERCKLCEAPLPLSPDFIKHGAPYAACGTCTHLNGLHEDTEAFCRAIYLDERYGEDYASRNAERFAYRVASVYRPKVDFLVEALAAAGEAPADLRYADFGAGSGYLVAAFRAAGLDRSWGLEVSPAQVEFANSMIGEAALQRISLDGTVQAAREVDAEVVSMIGVLEHLRQPRAVLQALRDNPASRYLFLCVPLFGLCVFLEMAFPGVFPRHLGRDHTHLFTDRSLEHMEEVFGLRRCAQWWFGSDMLDLYRAGTVSIARDPGTRAMVEAWTERMRPLIDPLQLQIDRRRLASEVHLLLEILR